jgi:hypothetical protein
MDAEGGKMLETLAGALFANQLEAPCPPSYLANAQAR